MTDLSDPNILPLAKSSQPLNRILGAQTDENGVASYALFPLHVLDQGSGVITKISVSQEDITAGQTSNGTLYVQSQDGQVHTSTVSFPAGAKGDKGDTGPQGPAGPPGESGDFATSLQLSNEAQIRTNSDASLNSSITNLQDTKINRTGDTTSGNLTFDYGSDYLPWSSAPQIHYRIGEGLFSIWGQVKDDNNMRLILGGNNPGQIYQSWQFNPTQKTLTTPTGNNVLETGNIGAPRMRQCFRVQVFNGGLISWPVAFARDDLVVASFSPQDNGNGQLHIVNYLYNTLPNRFNCQVEIETINKNNSNQIQIETSPVTIDVTVEGWTA